MHILFPALQAGFLVLSCHVEQEIDSALRATPLVVIPGNQLEEALLALEIVLQGCARVVETDEACSLMTSVGTIRSFVFPIPVSPTR